MFRKNDSIREADRPSGKIRRILPVFVLLAVLFLPGLCGTKAQAAQSRKSLPRLQLTKLTDIAVPSGGRYLEGGAAAPSGLLLAFLATPSDGPNPLVRLDTDSWKETLRTYAQLSHVNDMCYVSGRKEIYAVPMDSAQVLVLDEDTLTVTRAIGTPQIYHAIGYDAATGRFAAMYVQGSGRNRQIRCDILDSSLAKVIYSFPVETNLTYQGMTVYGSRIYYACWERGAVNKLYEPYYDGVLKANDNVVYEYDFSGNLLRTLLIPAPAGFLKFELETLSFSGGRMLLQFNEQKNSADRRAGIYAVTGLTAGGAQSVSVSGAEGTVAALTEAKAEAQELRKAQQKAVRQYRKTKLRLTAVKPKKRQVSLKWGKVKCGKKKASGYVVQICATKDFDAETAQTYAVTGVKHTFTGLTPASRYFVRVRAFYHLGKEIYWSKWSAVRKVRTKA